MLAEGVLHHLSCSRYLGKIVRQVTASFGWLMITPALVSANSQKRWLRRYPKVGMNLKRLGIGSCLNLVESLNALSLEAKTFNGFAGLAMIKLKVQ